MDDFICKMFTNDSMQSSQSGIYTVTVAMETVGGERTP